jgi:hypothetical protein
MATVKKEKEQNEEKIWDNPKNPIEASDSRDKEQIQRLYNEAKRRKENLTQDDQTEQSK